MKLYNKQLLILAFIASMFFTGCDAYDTTSQWWSNKRDDTIPGQISDVSVISQEGAVMINYTHPADTDFIAVRCVYDCDSTGKKRERWSSYRGKTIILDGFTDTNEHMAELYSVDRGGNMSKPIQRPVRALKSPVFEVREHLITERTWEGIRALWINRKTKEMLFEFYVFDEASDTWILEESYFSKTYSDQHVFKVGVERQDVPIKYRIEVSDHFRVYAVPLDSTAVPLKKNLLSYSFAGYNDGSWRLRGDYPPPAGDSLKFLTDSVFLEGIRDAEKEGTFFRPLTHYYIDGERTDTTLYMPSSLCLTFDFGKPTYINSFKMWIQAKAPIGHQPFIGSFEVWGSNTLKAATGDPVNNWKYWTDWGKGVPLSSGDTLHIDTANTWISDGTWVKICNVQNYKLPSGQTAASDALTAADQLALRAGLEYTMTYPGVEAYQYETEVGQQSILRTREALLPYRYFRMRVTKNTAEVKTGSKAVNIQQLSFSELQVWGNQLE